MKISHIVAISENRAIGKDNDLVCHLPGDMKFFRLTTTGHHIIMGRKNYESIGRPLPNRTNVIISRDANYKAEGCITVTSIQAALDLAKANGETEAFIIGGGQIYAQSLDLINSVYLTQIHQTLEGDTFYPELEASKWKQVSEEKQNKDEKNKFDYSFLKLERIV